VYQCGNVKGRVCVRACARITTSLNRRKNTVRYAYAYLSNTPRRRIHCLIKHYIVKTYWGSGSIVPRNFNLGTRWRWVVSFKPRLLYSRTNNPRYPVDRRLGGSQRGLEAVANRKSLCVCWKSNPGRPGRRLVTILTELPGLS
jgi:hypothetical protein